jgi:short subunit dehydrogenase-like uncharacterized protein
MANHAKWMIYGANGYTGHLIAVEAKRRGLKPVLAGRSADPIHRLMAELGLPAQIFDLSDIVSSTAALSEIAVVVNCAGPFTATSGPMIEACLKSRTHYLDITGEIEVFVAAQRRQEDAKSAGVVICAVLKEALLDANPPRSGIREDLESGHRAHDGEIASARPARWSSAAEWGDRGRATCA